MWNLQYVDRVPTHLCADRALRCKYGGLIDVELLDSPLLLSDSWIFLAYSSFIFSDKSFFCRIAHFYFSYRLMQEKIPLKKEDSAQSVLHVVLFLFFASGCEFNKLFACALRSVFIVITLCIAISKFGSAHILICSFFVLSGVV
ncbi:hypothetical protein [Cytobacillus sp. FSL H8-0458]|uniref:hypothetical protein n=1 Tax=Cytobacillus sp. FSL H8-0458 TaxID=2975346 RepID=UPI0030F9A64C